MFKSIRKERLLKIALIGIFFISESLVYQAVQLNFINLLMYGQLDQIKVGLLSNSFIIASGIHEYCSGILTNKMAAKWCFGISSTFIIVASAILHILCNGYITGYPAFLAMVVSATLLSTGCAMVDALVTDVLIYNDSIGLFSNNVDVFLVKKIVYPCCSFLALIISYILGLKNIFVFTGLLHIPVLALHIFLGHMVYRPSFLKRVKEVSNLVPNISKIVYLAGIPTLLTAGAFLWNQHSIYKGPGNFLISSSLVAVAAIMLISASLLSFTSDHALILAMQCIVVTSFLNTELGSLMIKIFMGFNALYLAGKFRKNYLSVDISQQRLRRGFALLINIILYNLIWAYAINLLTWLYMYHCESTNLNFQSFITLIKFAAFPALIFFSSKKTQVKDYNNNVSLAGLIVSVIQAYPFVVCYFCPLDQNLNRLLIAPALAAMIYANVHLLKGVGRAVYYFFPEDIRKLMIGLISLLNTAVLSAVTNSSYMVHILENNVDRLEFRNAFLLVFIVGSCISLAMIFIQKKFNLNVGVEGDD